MARLAREVPRSPLFRSVPRLRRMRTSAGTSPKSTVAPEAIASANPSTRQLIAASASRGISTGVAATMIGSATVAATVPTIAPPGEHGRLGEELHDEVPGRRAERRAHGHLALARERAREEQRRDVQAADHDEQADGAEEHDQRRPVVAELLVHERNQPDAPSAIGCREFLFEPRRQAARVGLRPLRGRRPGAAAATASMKCAPRLWLRKSQAERCQTSMSPGKSKRGGMTPTTVHGAPFNVIWRPTIVASA